MNPLHSTPDVHNLVFTHPVAASSIGKNSSEQVGPPSFEIDPHQTVEHMYNLFMESQDHSEEISSLEGQLLSVEEEIESLTKKTKKE
ncbi:hypothetical protein [Parachlamydia sp. AcF125]|uniref:hypothetical protein n=1 Tax=Parachlamydia sp. AcF125 TaxID=2795736 RepID=UPI001BC9A87A|nr:hypothetical protein [Parachlamydia sp. AcF125]MBS4169113.1 hypothetical protein [Parachlamydia sp. AcF125]